MSYPLGALLNAAIQTATLALLLVGLGYGIRTRRKIPAGSGPVSPARRIHMNVMTAAVLLSGLGLLIWMLPNFLLGWGYGATGLGYGTGGYESYLQARGSLLPHWYLIVIHVILGSLAAVSGVYLVLRMRWRRFPRILAVRNYRALMIGTWAIWFADILVGYAIFYFFALGQTG